MANVETLQAHIEQLKIPFGGVIDLCHLFGIGEKGRKNFFRIIRAPDAKGPPKCDNDYTRRFCERLERALGTAQEALFFVLTFRPILDCVVSTGLFTKAPAITRVHPLDEEAHLEAELYRDADLLVTQTLLGTKVAIEQGIPPWRLLYVPYQTPVHIDSISKNSALRKSYLESVAERMGKRVHITEKSVVVVCPTRFDFRKNVEYALTAFAAIAQDLPDALLLLKGSFDRIGDIGMGKGYTENMSELLRQLAPEPWLLWDPERRSSHQEALQILQHCDLGLNLCGTADPLNSTIEMLLLGKPVILLEGGGPLCAMDGTVTWVKNRGISQMRLGSHPFHLPDMEDLQATLVRLIHDQRERLRLGLTAREEASKRFGFSLAKERLTLGLEAAFHYFHQTEAMGHYQKRVLEALREDQQRFCFEVPCAY